MMQITTTRSMNASRKRAVCLTLAALLVLILLVLGYFYRRFLLSGLDLAAEATGSRMTAVLCLALGLLALLWLFIWMLFPIIVYVGLKDLRRRTAELDRTTKLCAQHLARATADRDAAKIDEAPAQQEPGAESP
jgi:uncharacterized Tic20 family protein